MVGVLFSVEGIDIGPRAMIILEVEECSASPILEAPLVVYWQVSVLDYLRIRYRKGTLILL